MDKTLTIDGKMVTFRKTAGTELRYANLFGRDFRADLVKLLDLQEAMALADKTKQYKAFLGMDTSWLYHIAFVMAQQADPSIKNELEWLDSFEYMDILQIMQDLIPMMLEEGRPSPKNV